MNSSRDVRLSLPSVFVYVETDGTNSTKEPDMPTLMVRYEIDDNAVDDVVKGRDRRRGQ
jgi:hypothetical protein